MTSDKAVHINLSEKSFEDLFKKHFTGLCLFAGKYISDFDTTKEIVHDVFIRLWEIRNKVDASKPLKSYLFTSVHNRCLNYIRDNKKYAANLGISEMSNIDFSENNDKMVELEMKEIIMNTISSLPEKCREIFELSRFEGLKYNEIAEKLNISVKTVEANISKALKILRENLIEYLTIFLILIYLYMKNK